MSRRRCLPEGFTAEGVARSAARAARTAVNKAEAGRCEEAFDYMLQARALLTMAAGEDPGMTHRGVGLEVDSLVSEAKRAFRKRCLVRRR